MDTSQLKPHHIYIVLFFNNGAFNLKKFMDTSQLKPHHIYIYILLFFNNGAFNLHNNDK